ncbi:MAG TPA: hypothetical protein V6D47_12960 [Oscillatoriaceae cyanobacterium]
MTDRPSPHALFAAGLLSSCLAFVGCDNSVGGQAAVSPLGGIGRTSFTCLGAAKPLTDALAARYTELATNTPSAAVHASVRNLSLSNTVKVDEDLNTLICETTAAYDLSIEQPPFLEEVAGKQNGRISLHDPASSTLPPQLLAALQNCQASATAPGACELDVTKTYYEHFRVTGAGHKEAHLTFHVVRTEQGDVTVPQVVSLPTLSLDQQTLQVPSRVTAKCRLLRPTSVYSQHAVPIDCPPETPAAGGWRQGWTPAS